eukprot:gene4713-5334_t
MDQDYFDGRYCTVHLVNDNTGGSAIGVIKAVQRLPPDAYGHGESRNNGNCKGEVIF